MKGIIFCISRRLHFSFWASAECPPPPPPGWVIDFSRQGDPQFTEDICICISHEKLAIAWFNRARCAFNTANILLYDSQ